MDGNTTDLINCFFSQLRKPVCLVAHNGNKFDYLILAEHLKKLVSPTVLLPSFAELKNQTNFYFQTRSLDADLLCVDSLEIFKKFDESNTTSSAIEEFLNTDLVAVQNRNEKTPAKSKSFAVIERAPGEKPKSAKCLFETPSTSTSTSTANGDVTPTPSQKSPDRISYKLEEIYKRLHNCQPKKAHNAEADTIHLLMCAIAIKNQFVELADSIATAFSRFTPQFVPNTVLFLNIVLC